MDLMESDLVIKTKIKFRYIIGSIGISLPAHLKLIRKEKSGQAYEIIHCHPCS
jgi:hypothetical protein